MLPLGSIAFASTPGNQLLVGCPPRLSKQGTTSYGYAPGQPGQRLRTSLLPDEGPQILCIERLGVQLPPPGRVGTAWSLGTAPGTSRRCGDLWAVAGPPADVQVLYRTCMRIDAVRRKLGRHLVLQEAWPRAEIRSGGPSFGLS